MVDEILKNELMNYVSPVDYPLHDWDKIIERRERYKENIYIYKLVYADIYLYEDLEFYDAEPKQPIHRDLTMNNLTEDNLLEKKEIEQYISPKKYDLINWSVVLSRKEQVKEGIYKYHILDMDLYFDEEMYIVEYGDVHIIDGKVYYDYWGGKSEGEGAYVLLGDVNYAGG